MNFTLPFGTHIAVVEIDRETGDVTPLQCYSRWTTAAT